jgi:hypothetical protein
MTRIPQQQHAHTKMNKSSGGHWGHTPYSEMYCVPRHGIKNVVEKRRLGVQRSGTSLWQVPQLCSSYMSHHSSTCPYKYMVFAGKAWLDKAVCVSVCVLWCLSGGSNRKDLVRQGGNATALNPRHHVLLVPCACVSSDCTHTVV